MWKFLTITIFAILWAIHASEKLDGNQLEKTLSGCNHTLTRQNGAFELNNHSISHLWTHCYWNITSNDTISLFFLHSYHLEDDTLTIYKSWEDAMNQTNPLITNPIKYPNGTSTLITNEKSITIALIRGKDASYDRILEGYYSVGPCLLPVKPDIDTLYPPSYMDDVSDVKECVYDFNKIQSLRAMQVFTFEEFDMPNSTLEVVDGTFSGEYKKENQIDFFTEKDKVLYIHVKQARNSTDYFKLKIHMVDSSCSGRTELSDANSITLKSPPNEINDGTIIYECRWLIQHKDSSKILGLKVDKADFHSVFDIASVNDGTSEISTPLFQITTSNKNYTQNQIIRASSSSLWVAFKPVSYDSRFHFNVTVHGQGGYLKNEGAFKMGYTTGNDTAFLLEVDSKEVVMLTFDSSSITPPATVSVYDGFDTTNLLTTLHGQINFPIFSRSSRMMVTGTNFDKTTSNQFSAKFRGFIPGCNHMSSLSTENYVLSQNCNASCVWIIPPQDVQNSALIVYLQFISLKLGDNIKIHKLDSSLTQLGVIGPDQTHVPHFSVPANVGILINVSQSNCVKKEDKVVLIGHSSYIPACNHNFIVKSSESLQISSPLYPDTYPLFTDCHWNITAPNGSIIHLAFQNMNLAENHCIKISQVAEAQKVFEGSTMPSDIFLNGNAFVDFDSSSCNKGAVSNTLNSDSGFLLNVTVADCGAVLDGKKSGEFSTNVTGTKSIGIWKVSVPPKDGDSVNIVSYKMSNQEPFENYELDVFDGSTVRDAKIVNSSRTYSEIWARTNTLIFVYKRLDVSKPSAPLIIKYNTISCNKSMQCDNGICMHPKWICNGANECGDYSDERKCAPVPIPPEVKSTGYSATSFWLCCIALMIIGIIVGIIVPIAYQRYKDSQYRRFHELGS